MSADEEIGSKIGKALLIGLVLMIGLAVLAVYAWHHFRFVS
jgi:hypothetical protein